mgnify:FL=1
MNVIYKRLVNTSMMTIIYKLRSMYLMCGVCKRSLQVNGRNDKDHQENLILFIVVDVGCAAIESLQQQSSLAFWHTAKHVIFIHMYMYVQIL